MNAWAELPNAVHIDRILADVRRRPQAWAAAWGAVWGATPGEIKGAARGKSWVADLYAARVSVGGSALVAVWGTARSASWIAALDAARGAAWADAWGAGADAALCDPDARDAAGSAIAALIAWDDAADVLSLPAPAVRLLAASGHDAAVLLLPAVIALETSDVF
jgi:hypothetical protein